MKKLFILFLIICMISIPVFGQNAKDEVYWVKFADTDNFAAFGTISTDYNEGKFHINDGVQVVFALEVLRPQETCFDGYLFDPETFDYIPCDLPIEGGTPETVCLTSANQTYYGFCEISPEDFSHIGHYYFVLNTSGYDTNDYWLEHVEILHAEISALMWVFGILTILTFFGAWLFKEGYMTIIGMFFFLGFTIETTFNRFGYIFKDWAGIITGIIVFIIVWIITIALNEWTKNK